jgi:nucleotide-binding universal stress UspA family protein
MLDTVAHPANHAGSTALAAEIASRLHLRPAPFATAEPPDAALAVASAVDHRHREPAVPVLVQTRTTGQPCRLGGRSIVCGVHDESDAPAAAIAAAVGRALELSLLLIHVLAPVPGFVLGPMAGCAQPLRTSDDAECAIEMLDRLAGAAGLDWADGAESRLPYGPMGPTLAATAQAEDAAMIVVSASARRRLLRALAPSVTGYLVRRSDRPVLVCPRHPAPAMRIREALSDAPQRAWNGP